MNRELRRAAETVCGRCGAPLCPACGVEAEYCDGCGGFHCSACAVYVVYEADVAAARWPIVRA